MMPAFPLKTTATLAVGLLVVTGLVTVAPAVAPPAAAVDAPEGSETFELTPGAGGQSREAFITADAQRVVFTSTADDLVAGDDNGVSDVFLSVAIPGSDDPFSGDPILISVPDGPLGAERADGRSFEPVASMDGRYVAFASAARNLVDVPAGTSGQINIFVRDTVKNTTTMIRHAETPNSSSMSPDLSDDGRYLVFESGADNLGNLDMNGAEDVYIADLAPNGDGVHSSFMSLRKVRADAQIATGTQSPVISGNGEFVAFTTRGLGGGGAQMPLPDLYFQNIRTNLSGKVGERVAGRVSIDATGKAMAYVRDDACADGLAAVVAVMSSANTAYTVALGTTLADRRSGYVADPAIAPDGSSVTWSTTVPAFDFGNGGVPAPALSEPVIRTEPIGWWDATGGANTVACDGVTGGDWTDVAAGMEPSVSATGRTIVYSSPMPAPVRIFAVDTHSHDGIAVTSTQGRMTPPVFMTSVPISTIPLTTLRGYAAALADSPIHRLPIHRLPIHRLPIHRLPIHRLLVEDSPIHRLPIHRLPIHRLPIHRLDLPGGWPQVLQGTPFADELIQSVTLDEVLAWAEANPTTDAGARIRSLVLEDLDIDGSGLDALTLASYTLGSAPLAELPSGPAGALAAWQRLADAQGLGVQVDDETVLADLDAAGLDIAASGVEALVLGDLPASTIDKTLLDAMPIDPALLPATPLGERSVTSVSESGRVALFGTAAVTGTFAAPSTPLVADATFADLATGTPGLTLGEVLFSLLDAASYPWEQIAASSIDPRLASTTSSTAFCANNTRCATDAPFRFAFDVGPGEATLFTAPTASITLPQGTNLNQLFANGSGPGVSWNGYSEYGGPRTVDGDLITVPLADASAGTVFELDAWFSAASAVGYSVAQATLTTGSLTAASELYGDAPLSARDESRHNRVGETWTNGEGVILIEGQLYFESISPGSLGTDEETGAEVPGPADDEDFYLVAPAPPGKRLVISTNATDGQIALSLYRAKGGTDAAASLGVENAGAAPGTTVSEQGTIGEPAEAGADTASAVVGQTLIDQAVQRGDGTASIEAASTDTPGAGNLLVRVTSGNGQASAAMYSLRVRYIDEPVETSCPAWTPAMPGMPTEPGVSDAVTDETNTLYLFDTKRYRDTYGVEATDAVRASLASLTGTGAEGSGVDGAVLSIDADPAVQAARVALDANPCSMTAREALATAVNGVVATAVDGHRDQIASIVIVGGDDILPFAPVAQHTSQFTEASHSDDLRLDAPVSGGACPAEVAPGQVDPCATPLSAAAKSSHVLTDDPYGLATAYESLGGFLYVPTAALGRLVETPAQIQATIARFIDADGVLEADSSVTGGYGAWSELPDQVTSALAWRSPANDALGAGDGLWSLADLDTALFPVGADSPRVVSINTHADEKRMLPGVDGAPDGAFDEADLFTTDAVDATDAAALAGSLVFLIGCHAGNNLPAAYYGDDAVDWVDVFSGAGGYVGNTGYGLANSVTTALSERLLQLYAEWIGVEVDGRTVTASEALTFAKQSYLGGLGLYTGYDEKVLMEAVYYGLPMYSFADATTTKSAPVPRIPEGLEQLVTADGMSSASLALTPSFQKVTRTDASGRDVSFLTADGQEPAVVAGQPVLPKIVSQLRAEDGLVPRGALITALTSQIESGVAVAIAEPGVGIDETTATKTDVAFPSSFATITRQETPTGPVDLLVVTPGRVEAPQGGTGSIERFTELGLDVLYTDPASTDTTAPSISAIAAAGGTFRFRPVDTGSAVGRMVLLVQPTSGSPASARPWQALSPELAASGEASVELPPMEGGFRWILQVADTAGNVTVESNRGRLVETAGSAPELGAAGDEATIEVGGTLQRSVEVTDAKAGELLSGSLSVTVAGTGTRTLGSTVPVVTGNDGKTRAVISQPFTTPGVYSAVLTVCRAGSCAKTEIDVTVPLPNTAPRVSVSIASSTTPVWPTAVLTAETTTSDADGDDVTAYYTWTRNGVEVGYNPTLALGTIGAVTGDVIAVAVMPSDGALDGPAERASVTVAAPPPLPQISAAAANLDGPYVEGSWSRSPVTVTFTCSGAVSVSCSAPQTISADTAAAGLVVTGTAGDLLGQTATAEMLVRVDRTAPVLSAAVTPNPVAQNATATVTPTASDAASGLGPVSCATPQTAVPGPSTVVCSATDAAGNTATAAAAYTVLAPAARMCKGLLDRTALAPLNADGSSVFLRTSGVPITFRACDAAGKPIATKNFVKSVTLVSTTSLPASAKINELWYIPITGFAYVKPAELWLGQISTVKLAGGKKYTYKVLLADGTSFTFTFGVR